MGNDLFTTPVSYHIFNRLNLVQKTFKVIQLVKPKVLFVTADGPRPDHPDDIEKCEEARRIVEQNIDWQCDLYKNYSDVNKGSYKCTSDGISWVFKNVDEAVFLEEDCLPDPSFFIFCEELLSRYRTDERIALISGFNLQSDMRKYQYSYYFSRYIHAAGWATWKRTWTEIDFEMNKWPEFRKNDGLKNIFRKESQIEYYDKIFNSMYDGSSKPHWDYKLLLSMFMNNALMILPALNLCSHIGAGPDGSNVKKPTKYDNIPTSEIPFPLRHPDYMQRLFWADEYTEKTFYSGRRRKLRYRVAPFFPPKIRSLIGRIFDFFENRHTRRTMVKYYDL